MSPGPSGAAPTGDVAPGRRPADVLPPPGPAWFPVVMGTGILATLLALRSDVAAWLPDVAAVPLALAWSALLGLSVAFAVRCARGRGVLVASLRDPAQSTAWGAVAMGLLAVGSATATVVPRLAPAATGAAFGVDLALWITGTLLGLYTALDFAVGLATRELGRPTPVWGLPVVAPMVSATTGCAFVSRLHSPGHQLFLLVATVACFGVSMVLAVVVFGLAYHHHLRREPVPLALRPSLWIPLGVTGQSTAAVQSIAAATLPLLRPELHDPVLAAAHAYGVVVLGVGGPVMGVLAVVWTVRGFRERMPFSPGWWAMTFPVGTCALGADFLGAVHGSPAWSATGLALTGVLLCTWTLCAAATACALLRAATHRKSRLRATAMPRCSRSTLSATTLTAPDEF